MRTECPRCGYATAQLDMHVCPGTTDKNDWPLLADAFQEYMSDISEEQYCAGWLIGLEYRLWSIVIGDTNGNTQFGLFKLTTRQIATLTEFSVVCLGWMMSWDRYVPMDDWRKVASGEWV